MSLPGSWRYKLYKLVQGCFCIYIVLGGGIVGDWKQSRDTFRARGLSEVVIFTPQEVSQGVDFFDDMSRYLYSFA